MAPLLALDPGQPGQTAGGSPAPDQAAWHGWPAGNSVMLLSLQSLGAGHWETLCCPLQPGQAVELLLQVAPLLSPFLRLSWKEILLICLQMYCPLALPLWLQASPSCLCASSSAPLCLHGRGFSQPRLSYFLMQPLLSPEA